MGDYMVKIAKLLLTEECFYEGNCIYNGLQCGKND